MSEIEFNVGEEYVNEKGPYEVLSIDKKSHTMVIKWESGETKTTAIGFQRRILERIEIELEVAEAAKRPKRSKASSSYGGKFVGLQDSDFSKSISRTTWRSRAGLGGAVTTQLHSGSVQINSWAVSRMPAIHWADVGHRKRDAALLQARFFAQVDEERLCYGFHVERSNEEAQAKEDDSNGFVDWLSDVKNESWLKGIMEEYDLRIYDMKDDARPIDGQIKVTEGNWRLGSGGDEKDVASLADFFAQLKDPTWVDLQIAQVAGKGDAIARGIEVAKDISGLFDILMPLYKAASLPW